MPAGKGNWLFLSGLSACVCEPGKSPGCRETGSADDIRRVREHLKTEPVVSRPAQHYTFPAGTTVFLQSSLRVAQTLLADLFVSGLRLALGFYSSTGSCSNSLAPWSRFRLSTKILQLAPTHQAAAKRKHSRTTGTAEHQGSPCGLTLQDHREQADTIP